jgi:Ni/Fe-hydrogenase subunit HybB-like protein
MYVQSQPLGGPILTRPYKLLLAFCAVALGAIGWRFAVGLGTATALTDGYPWGLWIAFDVVTGTALASGGYAMALLVYILNKGRYHPLVRPAMVTSALGYTMAALAIVVDVGRPWHVWKIPFEVWHWNLNSALLEVALCVMAYTAVLYLELAPALLERWKDSRREGLRRFATAVLPRLDRALIWILAAGMLLPTMHQSSLGALMLLTGPRLHPLWSTPFLPLLFLVSTLAMGYAAVVFESTFSSFWFRRPQETPMLGSLQRVAVWTSAAFVAFRFLDLAWRGRLGLLAEPGVHAVMFWLETALFLAPLAMMLSQRGPSSPRQLFSGAVVLAAAGALYRFDTYLVAFDPGPGWHYFPSVGEILITCGIIAFEIALYLAVVKKLPIFAGAAPAPGH